MPWDSTRLRVAADAADGSLGPARTVAGGPGISIVQPAWRADGVLHYVSDESGWWNLYALDGEGGLDGPARNLAPMEVELGDPAWVFGRSSYAFTDDGGILAVGRADGRDTLLRITRSRRGLAGPRTRPRRSPRSRASWCGAGTAVLIGAGPHDGAVVARLDPRSGTRDRRPRPIPVDADRPRAPAARRAHRLPDVRWRDGARPVLPADERRLRGPGRRAAAAARRCPTAARRPPRRRRCRSSARSSRRAGSPSWTSTTGARPATGARTATRSTGEWGIVDVDDCVAAAQFLADRGSVDRAADGDQGRQRGRLHDPRRAHDQARGLRRRASATTGSRTSRSSTSTATSSSRATTRGCSPRGRRAAHVFRERSPIHAFDRDRRPDADHAGPRRQGRAAVAARRHGGGPARPRDPARRDHASRARATATARADSRRRVYAAELSFLGQVFGFTPGGRDRADRHRASRPNGVATLRRRRAAVRLDRRRPSRPRSGRSPPSRRPSSTGRTGPSASP